MKFDIIFNNVFTDSSLRNIVLTILMMVECDDCGVAPLHRQLSIRRSLSSAQQAPTTSKLGVTGEYFFHIPDHGSQKCPDYKGKN